MRGSHNRRIEFDRQRPPYPKMIEKELGEEGAGTINISNLLKIKVVRKPATPERKGINPFTKEETVFKAKPAKNVVKLVPLRGLKDLV